MLRAGLVMRAHLAPSSPTTAPTMLSVFEIFHIGIGPSSSHTVGPMRAALMFARELESQGLLPRTVRVVATLHGSLGATGKGHGTDRGVVLGLAGNAPDTIEAADVISIVDAVRACGKLSLLGHTPIGFKWDGDIVFKTRPLPAHPNGLILEALDSQGATLMQRTYYSIGGGAVTCGDDVGGKSSAPPAFPHAFQSAAALLRQCHDNACSISELVYRNEAVITPAQEIAPGLDSIWRVMQDCVRRGLAHEGVLPGPMKVRRRAPELHALLLAEEERQPDALHAMDWLNLCAMAVSEENAAGGRVVTAPTNGAAGIIPSVLHYYMRYIPGASVEGVHRFLLAAAAIGMLYKTNASISGAEVGCQGEVGVACSMAAGGLCEVLSGSPEQVEHAAEIAMEHHLGLTCDPVGGLVQIPCIERNAVASAKAVNSVRLAMRNRAPHHVSLDAVIRTMWQTGQDMKTKYKETARGGLAINIKQC